MPYNGCAWMGACVYRTLGHDSKEERCDDEHCVVTPTLFFFVTQPYFFCYPNLFQSPCPSMPHVHRNAQAQAQAPM